MMVKASAGEAEMDSLRDSSKLSRKVHRRKRKSGEGTPIVPPDSTSLPSVDSLIPRFVALQEGNSKFEVTLGLSEPAKKTASLKPVKKRKKKVKMDEKESTMATTDEIPVPVPPAVEEEVASEPVELQQAAVDYSSSSTPLSERSEEDEFRSEVLQVNYKSHTRLIENMVNNSLMSPVFSDILLTCENEIFHCHKLILAAASEHLALLMEKITTPGSQQVLMMTGVKSHILRSVLEFIYKGNVLVSQENLGDFIKIGTELRIHGLYCREVTPSSSTTELDNANDHCENGLWRSANNNASLNFPASAADLLTTEMQETLPESTLNDSRTITAPSDVSFDDGDEDFMPTPRIKRFTQGSLSATSSMEALPSITSYSQDYGAPRLKSSKVPRDANNDNAVQKLLTDEDQRKIVKNFLMFQESPIAEALMASANLPVAGTSSSASRSSKKRPAGGGGAQPTPDVKKKKNDTPSTTRPTKEEKEKIEVKMEAAIKMAMETHNVVRSATTFGVATSTLRGRLKKLGYSAPAKPTKQQQAEQVAKSGSGNTSENSNNSGTAVSET